jgi:hypothetical protein
MYAKYHYKTKLSVSESLSVIIGERCGLSSVNMNPQTIYNVLFHAMRQCQSIDWQRAFEDFISHFHCNVFFPTENYNDDSHEARYSYLLGKIAFVNTKDILFHIDLDSRSNDIQRLLDEYQAAKVMGKWKGLGYSTSIDS